MQVLIRHLTDLRNQCHDKMIDTTDADKRELCRVRIDTLNEAISLLASRTDPVKILQEITQNARLVPCKNGGEDATEEDVKAGNAIQSGKWRVESSVDGVLGRAIQVVNEWAV